MPRRRRRRVHFANTEPTDREFFEEYEKYNDMYNMWFNLIFVLRCFVSLCYAIQLGPYEVPVTVDLYMHRFSASNISNSHGYEIRKEFTVHVSMLKSAGISFGGVLGGVLGDIYGRRIVSLVSSVIWSISSWIIVAIENQYVFDTLYTIVIINCTVVELLTFITFAEMTKRSNRVLVLFTLPTFILGLLIADRVTVLLRFWRYLLIFTASTSILTVFICWYMPESPTWLINKSRKKEAFLLLGEISGTFCEIECAISTNAKLMKGFAIIRKMFTYIFTQKPRKFFVVAWMMFIACIYFNWSKTSIVSYYVSRHEFSAIAIYTGFFSYLLLFPIVSVLGQRCGLFFTFLLLTLQSLIATFTADFTSTIYFDVFGLLFGNTAICLLMLYIIEIFPTFFRATALGCGFAIFGLTIILGVILADKGPTLVKYYYWILSGLGLSSMTGLLISEKFSHDLPNYKLE